MDQFTKAITGWNNNGRMVITTCRHSDGQLIGFITQHEDWFARVTEIFNDECGWEHLIKDRPWYPLASGKTVEEVMSNLTKQVNAIPKSDFNEWQVACCRFERELSADSNFDGHFNIQTLPVGKWNVENSFNNRFNGAEMVEDNTPVKKDQLINLEPVFKVDPNDPNPGRSLNLMAEQLNVPHNEFVPSATHPIFEYVQQREEGYNHLLTTLQWAVLRNRCLDYVARVIENGHTYDIRENIIVHPLVMDLLLGKGIWIDHDGYDDGNQAVHTFTNVYLSVYKESLLNTPTNSVVFDFSKETLFLFSSDEGLIDIKLLDNGSNFEVDPKFKEMVGQVYLNKLLKILSRVSSRLNITQTERTNHPGKVSLTDEFLSTVLALSVNAGANNDDFTAFGKELPVQLAIKYLELNKGK